VKRSIAKTAARCAGAVVLGLAAVASAALLYCVPMPGESLRGPPPKLTADERQTAEELRRYVTKLAVDIGVRSATVGDSLGRAERYLHDELAPLTSLPGITLTREAIPGSPGDAANLVLNLPGQKAGPLVLIGAHYDSAPGGTPAANDNGSGTAAALVLARHFAGTQHALPLRIVLFANEEMPYFTTETMGSLWHARGCQRRGEALRAMLSLETMGYYSDAPGSQKYPAPLSSLYSDRGNFIGFVGNLGSRGLVREAVGSFRAHASIASEGAALPAELPGVGWSDHWAFWQVGYPAIMVTDTALFRDPNYHELSDTPDQLDFERLGRVVVGLQATILELATP
jgi:Peptidase family M28